jgi:hypothetical protein
MRPDPASSVPCRASGGPLRGSPRRALGRPQPESVTLVASPRPSPRCAARRVAAGSTCSGRTGSRRRVARCRRSRRADGTLSDRCSRTRPHPALEVFDRSSRSTRSSSPRGSTARARDATRRRVPGPDPGQRRSRSGQGGVSRRMRSTGVAELARPARTSSSAADDGRAGSPRPDRRGDEPTFAGLRELAKRAGHAGRSSARAVEWGMSDDFEGSRSRKGDDRCASVGRCSGSDRTTTTALVTDWRGHAQTTDGRPAFRARLSRLGLVTSPTASTSVARRGTL